MPRHGLVSMAKNHTHHIKGLENIYPQSSHLLLCQIVSCDYWSSLGQGIIVEQAVSSQSVVTSHLSHCFWCIQKHV